MRYAILLLLPLFGACASVGQLDKFQAGTTRDDVVSELGKPDERNIENNREYLTYTLRKASKTWQLILAAPTLGFVFAADRIYTIELTDGKLTGLQDHTSSSTARGLAGFNKATPVSCTSTPDGHGGYSSNCK